jgi:hypothetical protein
MVLVVGALLGAGGVAAFRRGGSASDASARAYHRWFDGPTRGDRASDLALSAAALQAWNEAAVLGDGRSPQKHLLDHPTSPPRVVWAGTVADTAAAVVVQRADITPKEIPGLDEGSPPGSDVWGFLRVDPEGTAKIGSVDALIGDDVPNNGVLGGWVDPDRGLGMLFDLGVPVVWSSRVEVTRDGSYGRVARPVRFMRGGISVVDVGRGTPLEGVVFGPTDAQLGQRSQLPGSTGSAAHRKSLDWSVPHNASRAPVVPISGLPVAVRLPGGRGWVVASPRATLRYRTVGGNWHVAGHEAALLPDADRLDVEVTRRQRRDVVRLD